MQTQMTMWDQMIDFFLSAFRFPGLGWQAVVVAIALGLVFGAIWLLAYQPQLNNRRRALLAVAAVSALLTWGAISFVQVPLQAWYNKVLLHYWDESTLLRWLLLAGIPSVLVSGLVQEAGKLVPVLFYRSSTRGTFDARTGLLVGAIAGAGFGVFEAIWVHNSTFASGLTWQTFQSQGLVALLPFLERFLAVAFHIAATALAGYGLAKGWGWRFYLIAACLHGASNFVVVLIQKGLLSRAGVEVYIAAFAITLTAVVMSMRWRMASDHARTYAVSAGGESHG